MIFLTIRTDKPEAEVGIYEDDAQKKYISWHAHRELSDTLHAKIDEVSKGYAVEAIIFYAGPGSFTGLRIGASVANAMSYSLGVPCVSTRGDNWIQSGIGQIQQDVLIQSNALPFYGEPPRVTQPKK